MSSYVNVSDLKERLTALSERMKTSSVQVGRKVSEQVTSVSDRMKDFFSSPSVADRFVEEATAESLVGPDWQKSLALCDAINEEQISSSDAGKAVKKRLLSKDSHIQLLTLTLLETLVKNCERMFSEIATEKILDDLVRLSEDSTTSFSVREKALKLIESWGEATEELRYLPVFEETYKSLKSRGVRFPGRDVESLAPIFTPPQTAPITSTARSNQSIYSVSPESNLSESDKKEILDISRNLVDLLNTVLSSAPPEEALKDEITGSLASQCQEAQQRLQLLIQGSENDDSLLFEALNVHDEVEKALSKYETLRTEVSVQSGGNPNATVAPVVPPLVDDDDSRGDSEGGGLIRNRGGSKPHSSSKDDEDAMADLDEMIFGKGGSSNKKNNKKDEDDLIVF